MLSNWGNSVIMHGLLWFNFYQKLKENHETSYHYRYCTT